jgi:hypothetical protein
MEKRYCPKCGGYDILFLSCGTMLCQNIHCLSITPNEENKKNNQEATKETEEEGNKQEG